MSTPIVVNGYVQFSVTNIPIPKAKIEIWSLTGGILSTAISDSEGKFSCVVIDGLSVGQSSRVKVYKNGILILETIKEYSGPSADITLSVSVENYDENVVDNLVDEDALNYMIVNGTLTNEKGLVIRGATIDIYENGFRTRTLLASTLTDEFGFYEARVSVRNVANTKILDKENANRSIQVEANNPGGNFIAISQSVSKWNDILTINLTATEDSSGAYTGLTVTEFEHLVSQINYITDNADIETITGYSDLNEEVEVIANSIGQESTVVSYVVKAFRFASELTENVPAMMYPLVVGDSAAFNPALKYNYEEIRKLIEDGIDNNLIPDFSDTEIDDFIDAVKDYQVTGTKAIPIQDEEFDFGSVLLPVFSGDVNKLDEFLSLYNTSISSIVEFWDNYENTVGEPAALRARMGIQLSGITGCQPEVIDSLLEDAETNSGLHEFATWTESDWIDRINDINSDTDRICVPAIIKANTETTEDAINEYAKKLKSTFQNLYPMTNIRSRMEGDEEDLLEDPDTRTEVVTFITDNPEFDLRLKTVHDINPDDCDLTNINDVDKLIEGLAPFQRLLRVTGGNPEAIAAMKLDNIQSAADVVDIAQSEFIETYKSAFGGEGQALEAYNLANHINVVTTSITTHISTNSSPAINQIPVLPSYNVTIAQLLSGSNSSSLMDMPSSISASFNMMGTSSYCTCKECLSLYSPAAYFTDIMKFIRKRTYATNGTTVPNPLNSFGYDELVRRRADLLHIDLSCKNTNTVVPYVDLVNEILENFILKTTLSLTPPASYQTKGTPQFLAAHPEHIEKVAGIYIDNNDYELVYDNVLSIQKYPFSLPFNLALEQARVYLKHLGISRYDLMQYFKAYNFSPTSPPADKVSDYLIYAEYLGISYEAANIITDISESEPWLLYGVKASNVNSSNGVPDPDGSTALLTGNWNEILTERLDTLLQQTGITYLDLLQFLETDLLNLPISGERKIAVINGAQYPEDTCNLKELQLDFISGGGTDPDKVFLKKFYRFIRLWRAHNLSINDWDVLLRSLNITEISNIDNSIASEFNRLCRVLVLSKRFGISPLLLATWWNNIDTHQYTNFKSELLIKSDSVYDKTFRNRSVINSPLNEFEDLSYLETGELPGSGDLPDNYTDHTAIIASCCGIEEDVLLQILQYLDISLATAVNISALSRIYAIARVAESLKLSVKDFLKVMKMIDPKIEFIIDATIPTTPQITDRIAFLEMIVRRVELIKSSRFSLDDLYYLVCNIDATGGSLIPKNKTIQTFYEDIRSTLQTEPIYVKMIGSPEDDKELRNRLRNIIYEKFTKQFNISIAMLNLVFPTLVTEHGDSDGFLFDLLNEDFIVSNIQLTPDAVIPGSDMPVLDFYWKYYYLSKVFSIVDKLLLNFEEFKYLFNPSTSDVVGLNFSDLPVSETPEPEDIWLLLRGVLMADNWMQMKVKLKLIDDDLVNLWKTIPTDNKSAFMSLLLSNNNWDENVLTELIGAGNVITASGILNVAFSDDFKGDTPDTISLMQKILNIINWVRITGLSAASLNQALLSGGALTLSDSQKVLLAAKGKYNEDQWLKIAKPLRDQLRRKQRKVLTDYILTQAKPSTGHNWRNENDVFAWFLVDVEMETCMMTSRLRLAISSAQLFVDRILLGIEKHFISTSNMPKINIAAGYIDQWEAWRKWYRIWEANRKVFLYPENWIEPELRDNKSVFFEELEAQLQEGEVTMDNVTDAVKQYLIKLNDVARLEPVGNYLEFRQTGNIVHAFSRTYGKPNRYYYRRLEFGEWTPWERIALEIKSEHVVPYVWNGRLHLFWMTTKMLRVNARPEYISGLTHGTNNMFFNKDVGQVIGNSNMASNDPKNTTEQLEITLNWAEYRNGNWLDQKIGTEKILLNVHNLLTSFLANPNNTSAGALTFYRYLTKNNSLSLVEFLTSRLFMYINHNKKDEYLQVVISFPLEIQNYIDDNALYLHSFIFPNDSNTDCRVLNDGFLRWNQPSPQGTIFENQRFNQKYGTNQLYTNGYKTISNFNKFFIYPSNSNSTGAKFELVSGSPLLKKVIPGGNYSVTTSSAYREIASNYSNPMGNRFFFADKKNVYYVYKIFNANSTALASNVNAQSQLYQVWSNYPTLTAASNVSNVIYSTPIMSATPLIAQGGNNSSMLSLSAPASSQQQWAYTGPLSSSPLTTNNFTAYYDLYRFITFYHPHVKTFFELLNAKGMDALMEISTQEKNDTMNFHSVYDPSNYVFNNPYPKDIVYFDPIESYSSYNWEIFYHIPMLVAQRLHDDQKFAEARKWYHYIFDPTCNVNDNGGLSTSKQRFWRFRPFYDHAVNDIETVNDLLNDIYYNLNNAVAQVQKWENYPFQPHVIARMRISAYMKNTLMKYLDNLIEWGDMLFKRDTIESLNEATQLYILAANLLGPKPKEIPQRAYSSPYSFDDIKDDLDEFSNVKVYIETLIDNNLTLNANNVGIPPKNTQAPVMFYFCASANDKLLAYWDTIADRLFKIRNCMNIDGVVRQLPLFDPPIDPAMLVKAAAAGLDMGSVLNDISSASQPIYRFSVYVQKTNELCNDVKALGGVLLSALEKKDAEQLALLRSGHELAVLDAVKQVKQQQLDEAKANLEALELTKANVELRHQYYSSRQYTNPKEAKHLKLSQEAAIMQFVQGNLNNVASSLSLTPQFHAQATFAIGVSFGGSHLSTMMSMISNKLGTIAAHKLAEANMSATLGGYDRRMDDWTFQAETALKEIEQIDKQIVAAQIRINIAENELSNHELQINNTRETDEFMRSKFSNRELYNWMVSQISSTYFQAYQVAYDLAKRTEKAYNNELAFATPPTAGFIQFGYWDSLKKGLLAGEKLQLDVRKMEAAYLENNKRELELTKHVSLLFLHPEALIDLRETGTCSFTIPSWLFELDYPGHYFRRIKSVSLSIPCVTGPYTTVSCQLHLTNANTSGVVKQDGNTRVTVKGSPTYSIATSTGQNDSGVFELNFRDERYLPFEGYGLDGLDGEEYVKGTEWTLKMTTDKELRQFDYNTISDVVVHINYTAHNGRANAETDDQFGVSVVKNLKNRLKGTYPDSNFRLPCYFTLAHQFSNEYHAGFQSLVPIEGDPEPVARLFEIPLRNSLFPYFCHGRDIEINEIVFFLQPKNPGDEYRLEVNDDDTNYVELKDSSNPVTYMGVYDEESIEIDADDTVENLQIKLYKYDSNNDEASAVEEDEINDLFIVFMYKLL